jgi:cytochrome b561
MRIMNSNNRYGIVAIALHWLMAILIIGLLILGLYMVSLPISHQKLKLYGWHKEYGFLALLLVTLRFIWRAINITPQLNLPWLEKIAARSVHALFYILLFAMPLTGLLITSAAGLPASFFGLFLIPTLIQPNEEWRILFQTWHQWIGYLLIAMIILHASAALKHHFINKDTILKRMLS